MKVVGERVRRVAARAGMVIVCASACGLAVTGMAVAAPGPAAVVRGAVVRGTMMRGAAAGAAAGWRIQSTPDVAGASVNFLNAVSCPSVSACVAVGTYRKSLSNPDQGFAERWTGTRWELQSTPNPAGAAVDLNGVSCLSASACTAVGDEAGSSRTVTLAEHWNGRQWAIQPTPDPPGAVESFLYGVWCSSADACTGVGYQIGATGTALPLAERWNGKHWLIQAMPTPRGALGSFTTGVSCPSATACTAVGYYRNSKNQQLTLAERWNSKRWAIQPTPDPAGAQISYLSAVSCSSLASCTASDLYITGPQIGALVEHWNGTRWVIQALPNVPGSTTLDAVSCRSAAACTAVGWTTKGVSQTPILAERWNGAHWSVQPTQDPPGDQGTLAAVSCPSVSTCTGVGSYVTSDGRIITVAEHD